MKVIKKHTRENNVWVERIRDLTIRDATIVRGIIGEKHIYAKYISNSKQKHGFSWSTMVIGMGKDRATKG